MSLSTHNGVPVISASKLKMFEKCPKQYYNKYVLGLPMKEWTAAHMGHAIHTAIQAHLTRSENPLYVFTQAYNALTEESTAVDRRKIPDYKRLGISLIQQIKWDELTPRIDFFGPFVEREFFLPYPNETAPLVYIQGIIDLVTNKDVVIDHKSSRELPKDLSGDLQFVIYHWAIKELFGEVKPIYWHHLRTGEKIKFEFTDYSHLDHTIGSFVKKYGKTARAFPKKTKDGFCQSVCGYYAQCWK